MKVAKKLINFRLTETACRSIRDMAEALETSQSEIVEQAVLLFEGMQEGGIEARVASTREKLTRDDLQVAIAEREAVVASGKERRMMNIGGVLVPMYTEDGKRIPFALQQKMAEAKRQYEMSKADTGAQETGRADIEYNDGSGAA